MFIGENCEVRTPLEVWVSISGWTALRQGMFMDRCCHIALLKECFIPCCPRSINMPLLRSEATVTINLKSEILILQFRSIPYTLPDSPGSSPTTRS